MGIFELAGLHILNLSLNIPEHVLCRARAASCTIIVSTLYSA